MPEIPQLLELVHRTGVAVCSVGYRSSLIRMDKIRSSLPNADTKDPKPEACELTSTYVKRRYQFLYTCHVVFGVDLSAHALPAPTPTHWAEFPNPRRPTHTYACTNLPRPHLCNNRGKRKPSKQEPDGRRPAHRPWEIRRSRVRRTAFPACRARHCPWKKAGRRQRDGGSAGGGLKKIKKMGVIAIKTNPLLRFCRRLSNSRCGLYPRLPFCLCLSKKVSWLRKDGSRKMNNVRTRSPPASLPSSAPVHARYVCS